MIERLCIDFFFSSRRRHTRWTGDWSSDVCSSDLPFGADVLERLAARHEIAYLLTQPDRPSGRGRRVAPPPAKQAAESLGIPVRQPDRLGDEYDPEVDTLVAVAYGQLVPRGPLERAR